jgi:hypothetical protein
MKRWWLVVISASLLALTACGGQQAGGGNGNGGGGGSANVAEPQAVAGVLNAANGQLFRINGPLAMAGLPVPVLGFTPFSSGVAPLDTANWSCDGVTASGDQTDADEDGIPVNATYNGRCTWSYSGGNGSISGYWEFNDLNVQDPDDNDPTAGVKASGTVEWGITSQEGSVTFRWQIDKHDLIKASGGYSFVYKGLWTINVTGEGEYTVNYDLSGTWAPYEANIPWGDGVMNATGSFSGSGPDCANGWTLNVTLTNLHFVGDKIVDGSATFSGTDCDGNSSSVTVNWSSDQVCVSFDSHAACYPQ